MKSPLNLCLTPVNSWLYGSVESSIKLVSERNSFESGQSLNFYGFLFSMQFLKVQHQLKGSFLSLYFIRKVKTRFMTAIEMYSYLKEEINPYILGINIHY